MTNKILLVEDDAAIGRLIEAVFTANGSEVIWCENSKQALSHLSSTHFDICILDYGLPGINGIDLANKIKETHKTLPILFVTANQELGIKYKAFENGCDDFILKPFQVRDLVLRVEAVLNRCKTSHGNKISHNSTFFDFDEHSRVISGQNGQIKLSSKEAKIFNTLLVNYNSVINRDLILKQVWGETDAYTSKCLDVYLSKLRKIINTYTNFELLNEHGVGYKLVEATPIQVTNTELAPN